MGGPWKGLGTSEEERAVEHQHPPEFPASTKPWRAQVVTGVTDFSLFRNWCPQAAGSRAPKVWQNLDRLISSSPICCDSAPHFVFHSCETHACICTHTHQEREDCFCSIVITDKWPLCVYAVSRGSSHFLTWPAPPDPSAPCVLLQTAQIM